jgi:hypothetical protein
MPLQVAAAALHLGKHLVDPAGLLPKADLLALDSGEGVLKDRAALPDVGRASEAGPVSLAGLLVLEELADLGKAEAGIVAEAADEAEPIEVVLVEQAVGALGAGGGLEQPELFVVADGPCGQADLTRDLTARSARVGQ